MLAYFFQFYFQKENTVSFKKVTTLQKKLLYVFEEELNGINIYDIGNLEDQPGLAFINEECGNNDVVNDG